MPEPTNLFEKIFEHSLDGVLLSRPDGTILRANRAACLALGRSEEEICRAGRKALVVEDAQLRDLLARRQTLGAVAGEVNLCRSDGSTFPAELTSGIIPSSEGAPFAYVIFRDISERRRIEERQQRAQDALYTSDAMLKGITDALPDPIFLKDREGRWTFANPATLEVVGKSLDQVLGRTDREIYADPAIGEALCEIDRRIMDSGVAEVLEETVQSPDGYRVYLSSKAPLRAQDGRVIGLIGTAQDITERKRDEEALRQREYLLSASQRAAHVGTWSWKVGDSKIYWSDETYRIYGLSPDMGPPDYEVFFEIVHPADRIKLREWPAAVVAGLHPPAMEFRVSRPDGSIRVIRTDGDVIESVDGVPSRIAGTAHDVTEQRQNEEALRESETRYRELFEASPVAISLAEIICDAEGRPIDYRLLYVNAAFERFMGMTAAKLVGRTIVEVSPRVDRAKVERACRVALTGVPDYFEGHSVGLNKDYQTTVYSPKRGQIVTYLADVTDRQQAEQMRREAHDRLAKIVATAPGIVCSFRLRPDGSACFPFGGERVAEHFGIPLARLSEDAAPFLALAHPDDLDGLMESIRESARRLVPWRREWRVRHPSRGELWIEAHSVPLREPDGSTLWHGVATDATERKRGEAERERLTMAIEQVAEEVIITDTRGVIVYVNPALEAVTGYTRAEILGQSPRIFKSGVHDQAHYRALWEAIKSGTTWRGRMVNRKKDGSHYTEDAIISPVRDANGIITSYVAVKRDISRDLALEAQLIQSQKMDAIGRLAGGVAHDFNNLLSVILSYTEFALGSLQEGDPPRDDLQEIERAGKRAATLTRQLLAFSRKQVMQPEPLDLNRVLAEMEKMLRRIIGEDIDLELVLAPELGIVRADPGQVEQVIMNLVVNARDAMPEGGELTVETANVELDAEHAGGRAGFHVMVAVSDSGVGMDEHTMAHAFEPFFTTKGVGKGTGLGLSTVYGIVKQSGGSIYVYSEPGKGTTFKVYLPQEPSLAPVVTEAAPVVQSSGEETILLVEDDEAVRKVANRILAGAGYTVLTAANGGEGLLLCEQRPDEIHLVLTDVVMPLMGGRVFVERLKKVRPGIKVLYMSGYTDDAIVHHGVLDAGTQFISKPLGRVELLRKVRAVLDG